MFELHYEPLIIDEKLSSWEIAVIPWDSEIFGFNIAGLRCSANEPDKAENVALEQALRVYAISNQIKLITTSVSAVNKATSLFLQQSGFNMIDFSIKIHYGLSGNHATDIGGVSVSPATSEQMERLVEIAGNSFCFGRYHMDTRIPDSLANQRYRQWLLSSRQSDNPQEVLAVIYDNDICGFSVVESQGINGYMHLHTIDSKYRGKRLGEAMVAESLKYLSSSGVSCVGTRISGSNLQALNMHARLKGKFMAVDHLLHWHHKEYFSVI